MNSNLTSKSRHASSTGAYAYDYTEYFLCNCSLSKVLGTSMSKVQAGMKKVQSVMKRVYTVVLTTHGSTTRAQFPNSVCTRTINTTRRRHVLIILYGNGQNRVQYKKERSRRRGATVIPRGKQLRIVFFLCMHHAQAGSQAGTFLNTFFGTHNQSNRALRKSLQ